MEPQDQQLLVSCGKGLALISVKAGLVTFAFLPCGAVPLLSPNYPETQAAGRQDDSSGAAAQARRRTKSRSRTTSWPVDLQRRIPAASEFPDSRGSCRADK